MVPSLERPQVKGNPWTIQVRRHGLMCGEIKEARNPLPLCHLIQEKLSEGHSARFLICPGIVYISQIRSAVTGHRLRIITFTNIGRLPTAEDIGIRLPGTSQGRCEANGNY